MSQQFKQFDNSSRFKADLDSVTVYASFLSSSSSREWWMLCEGDADILTKHEPAAQ